MNKIQRLEKYISDFFSTRWEDYTWFWKATHQDRQHGVYLLKNGPQIMDFLFGIKGIVEDNFLGEHLIPQRFTTPQTLFLALNYLKEFLNKNQFLLDQNMNGEDTEYVISHAKEFVAELLQMIEYAKEVYDIEDSIIPYQDLRYALVKRDVAGFISILKSIHSSVSYAITKTAEGYYHSNVHLILKLLGFEIFAEDTTNVGRIDAVIFFIDTIYIFEFKFSADTDESQTALQQIIDKDYANKYQIAKKEIIGVGVSFSHESRNINGFKDIVLTQTLLNT